MTNQQIIADIAASIYGKDAVNTMLENGIDIPLHTVQGWATRGPYRVKKGEYGIETKLWKKRKTKKNAFTIDENDVTKKPSNQDFYMATAFLFSKEQVEKIVE